MYFGKVTTMHYQKSRVTAFALSNGYRKMLFFLPLLWDIESFVNHNMLAVVGTFCLSLSSWKFLVRIRQKEMDKFNAPKGT